MKVPVISFIVRKQETISFTLLYFKMAVISLVPETKMVDVSKLISLKNLLARKVPWFVLTTTSAPLILFRAFGADHMRRIAYIYTRLPRIHSLTFWLPQTALSLSSFSTSRNSLTCQLVRYNSIRVIWVRIHSATFFFPVLPFRLDLFQSRTRPQKFRQTPKGTNNQHGRRIHCYIFLY